MKSTDYQFKPSEGSILVEIYLPKKAKYQGVLYETLTGGFEFKKVQKYMKSNLSSIKEFYYKISDYQPQLSNWMAAFFDKPNAPYGGYSLYEVDGVFRGENQSEIIEERTQIIRIIFKPNLADIYREFSFSKDPIENEDCIRDLIKTYFGINRHSIRFGQHQKVYTEKEKIKIFSEKFEKTIYPGELDRFISYMIRWSETIGFFLFGYIIHNICRRISNLRRKEKEKGEEEIWVTSIWNHKVNRIILKEDNNQGKA